MPQKPDAGVREYPLSGLAGGARCIGNAASVFARVLRIIIRAALPQVAGHRP